MFATSPAVEPEGGKVRRNLPIAIFGKPPDVVTSYDKHHMRSHSSLSWKSTKIITGMKKKTRTKLRKGKDSTKIIIQSRQFMSDDTSVNVSSMMVTT